MIETPATRERFLDSRGLALAGGIVAALTVLGIAQLLIVTDGLDRAAWDRVASALADAPASDDFLVVRAATRTEDWRLAHAVMRLDSAGARAVGVAADLSTPVAPGGTLPDLLTVSPHAVLGVTPVAGSVAWPWFLADGDRERAAAGGRLGVSDLTRDPDGVVRVATASVALPREFADLLATALVPSAATSTPPVLRRRIRYASTARAWYGMHSVPIDTVLGLPLDALRARVAGRTILLGIDDGSSIPTSVGAMPALAIVAHDVNDRAGIRRGAHRIIVDAGWWLSLAWVCAWIVLASSLAAAAAVRLAPVIALGGVLLLVALVLWLADARGTWLPLGTTLVAWCASIGGVGVTWFWQSRRRQHLTTLLFSRFVTPALADEAWSARHLYLQGGRPTPMQLPVTVLFVDLRGFTRFSEAHSADEVMQLLTTVTAACATDITAHGGLVDDFAGDGIKADFGVPVPRAASSMIALDARNAVRCAQALARTIARLVPDTIGSHGTLARIGVHSGTGVAGTIGGASRLKYTVVGDVVNVAARLQSIDLADDVAEASLSHSPSQCRIVISHDTMTLLAGLTPPATDLGMVTLAGRTQPVHAYRLHPDHIPHT